VSDPCTLAFVREISAVAASSMRFVERPRRCPRATQRGTARDVTFCAGPSSVDRARRHGQQSAAVTGYLVPRALDLVGRVSCSSNPRRDLQNHAGSATHVPSCPSLSLAPLFGDDLVERRAVGGLVVRERICAPCPPIGARPAVAGLQRSWLICAEVLRHAHLRAVGQQASAVRPRNFLMKLKGIPQSARSSGRRCAPAQL